MKGLEDAIGLTVRELFVINIHLRVQLPFNFIIALNSGVMHTFALIHNQNCHNLGKYHLSDSPEEYSSFLTLLIYI